MKKEEKNKDKAIYIKFSPNTPLFKLLLKVSEQRQTPPPEVVRIAVNQYIDGFLKSSQPTVNQ